MGALISKQIQRYKDVKMEKKALADLKQSCGCDFPGCDYRPPDRKNWMSTLNPHKLRINLIVWPGTHDSATNKIGIPLITRPFAQCQTLSIYEQLSAGARALDVRVQEDGRICHGILLTYSVDVVITDVRKFLDETQSEILILEIRTEFGHTDPPNFDQYLRDQLGDYLIHHDDRVFKRTIADLLPRRVICVWNPREAAAPAAGDSLWSGGYLKDNWINTDKPWTKFESNLKRLGEQPPAAGRRYFYRVENTVTPQADNPIVWVRVVTSRIRPYARTFMAQCFARGILDRLHFPRILLIGILWMHVLV
ncbi:uncharacterized protein LOC125187213 [Salvia hispanica]|uniref:uncharacterized protein LOC125187213 n=1 Tax=Salvia hispanica TaxID=49212 RepID=UPI002009D4EE|nr:uncharacterized protein LOC125187213 [Salvia hispanica]